MDKRSDEESNMDREGALVSAGRTHVGNVRANNEDSFIALDALGVWAVADGMGGYRDGDVASRMVCRALDELDASAPFDETITAIKVRLAAVNRHLYKAAVRLINPVQSGSTAAVLLVRDDKCAAIWAGDSRIYRYRDGELTRLTTDHTLAAELNLHESLQTGHAITRAVGGDSTLALDVRRDHVRPGDRYLLCTDGLTHELTDAEIAALLAQGTTEQCADSLIRETLARGAHDNVTVLVVDVRL